MSQYTIENPVKTKLKGGGVALGLSIRLSRSADVVRIAKASGHDFIFVDCQHSLFNLETIGHMAQTALAVGVAPVVRVRSVEDPDVSLLLDNGVTGIVYPDVNTADEARRGVDRAKFAPIGKRSVSGGYPFFDYRAVPLSDSVPAMNEATLVVCMIETLEGLENVEAIAAVPGVDVIHMGTNDLLVNMGKAGKFEDPQIIEAQARVNAACEANGIYAGCGGNRDVARQAAAIRGGSRFLTTQTDLAFLTAAAGAWTKGLSDALAAG